MPRAYRVSTQECRKALIQGSENCALFSFTLSCTFILASNERWLLTTAGKSLYTGQPERYVDSNKRKKGSLQRTGLLTTTTSIPGGTPASVQLPCTHRLRGGASLFFFTITFYILRVNARDGVNKVHAVVDCILMQIDAEPRWHPLNLGYQI